MTILLLWTSHYSLTMSLSKYINAPAYLLLSGSSGYEDIASDLLWVINTQNHEYIPNLMVALHVTHPKKHYPPVLNNEITYFDIGDLFFTAELMCFPPFLDLTEKYASINCTALMAETYSAFQL